MLKSIFVWFDWRVSSRVMVFVSLDWRNIALWNRILTCSVVAVLKVRVWWSPSQWLGEPRPLCRWRRPRWPASPCRRTPAARAAPPAPPAPAPAAHTLAHPRQLGSWAVCADSAGFYTWPPCRHLGDCSLDGVSLLWLGLAQAGPGTRAAQLTRHQLPGAPQIFSWS